MDIGMYQGAAALNAYEEWQNNTAHNLANVSTTGFKARHIAIEKESLGKIPMSTFSKFERMLGGSSPEATDATVFNQAEVTQTNKPTDIAIDGEGFFNVRQPDGSTLYTRNGHFSINHEYTLTNSEGKPVLGEGGNPITLDPQLPDMVINRMGEIWQGETQVGRLAVTKFENKEVLHHVTGGYLLQGETKVEPAEPDEFRIYQGRVENSNASAMREMMGMINLSRSYETNTKIVQTYDSRYGQTIQALGTT